MCILHSPMLNSRAFSIALIACALNVRDAGVSGLLRSLA
jgi:hypothetical protein